MKSLYQGILGLVLTTGMIVPASALTVNQTTNLVDLSAAVAGFGITVNSVSINNGAAAQFGTFSGFNGAPFSLADGIVLSTGHAVQTTAAYHSSSGSPSTGTGAGTTSEFTGYATGRVTNFSSAHDVASLTVNFSLASAGAVKFDWGFGSVEYPVYTSSFTDAFFAFLDGTSAANQIVYDSNHVPVQVGNSFAGSLITNDTNTAFSNPHGILMGLSTTTGSLAAGNHSLTFEIGDVNDGALDTAVFISSITAVAGEGTELGPITTSVPEPGTWVMGLLVCGSVGYTVRHRKVAAI